MYSFLTILLFYFKCFPDKSGHFVGFEKEKYASNFAQLERGEIQLIVNKTFFDKIGVR